MMKVLFLLECDQCRMPNTTVLASNEFDEVLWNGWMTELPLSARRFSGWQVSEGIHLCPVCYEELSYHSALTSK